MKQKLFLSCILGLGLFVSGCGDDDDGFRPVEQPTGELDVDWQSVENQRITDMIDNDTCDMPFQFEVDAAGKFKAGPCTSGGSDVKSGQITSAELTELDRLATAVLASDVSVQNCIEEGTIVGSSTALQLDNGQAYKVYRHDPLELCYRGEREISQALHQHASKLSEKYYPKRQAEAR